VSFSEESAERWGHEPQLRRRGGGCREKRQLSFLQIGDPGLACEVRRQEAVNKPGERA